MSLFRAPLFATPKIASLSSSSFHSFSQPLVCSACRGSHANIQCTSGVPSSSGYPSTVAFSSFMDDELSAAYKRLNEYRRLCSQLLLEKSSLLRQLSSRRKSRRDAFVQAPISAPTVPTFAPHSKLSLPERPVSPASNPIRPVPIRPPLLSLSASSKRAVSPSTPPPGNSSPALDSGPPPQEEQHGLAPDAEQDSKELCSARPAVNDGLSSSSSSSSTAPDDSTDQDGFQVVVRRRGGRKKAAASSSPPSPSQSSSAPTSSIKPSTQPLVSGLRPRKGRRVRTPNWCRLMKSGVFQNHVLSELSSATPKFIYAFAQRFGRFRDAERRGRRLPSYWLNGVQYAHDRRSYLGALTNGIPRNLRSPNTPTIGPASDVGFRPWLPPRGAPSALQDSDSVSP